MVFFRNGFMSFYCNSIKLNKSWRLHAAAAMVPYYDTPMRFSFARAVLKFVNKLHAKQASILFEPHRLKNCQPGCQFFSAAAGMQRHCRRRERLNLAMCFASSRDSPQPQLGKSLFLPFPMAFSGSQILHPWFVTSFASHPWPLACWLVRCWAGCCLQQFPWFKMESLTCAATTGNPRPW